MPSHNTLLRNIMNGAINGSNKEGTSEEDHFYYRIEDDLVRVDHTRDDLWCLTSIDERFVGFFPRLTEEPEKDIESALDHQEKGKLARNFLVSYTLMKSNKSDGLFLWNPDRSKIMELGTQKTCPVPHEINQALFEFTKSTVLLDQEYEEIMPCRTEIVLRLPQSAHERMHFIQRHDSLLHRILGGKTE